MKPQKLQYSDLDNLKEKHPELIIHDKTDLAIDELYDIKHPEKKDSKESTEVEAFGKELTGADVNVWGNWFYYPWLNTVVHFPPKAELQALRTSRNRDLVTAEEQLKLLDASILIAGMSVGSNIVEALVSQGIGGTLVVIDMDIIEPSNLNRIRSPFHHVGIDKVEAVSRKVWEIDPYIEVIQVPEGLNQTNLPQLVKDYKIDVLVDEMDDLKMKIMMREVAKSNKLPVISAADDGDNSLVDIERYDLNPDAPIFAGRIPEDILEKIKAGNIPRAQLGMMIGKYFVGAENTPLRMFESLVQVGKTLPSWPQLGGAAALSGVSVAYTAKKIILGQSINDGRVLVSIDEKIDKEHLDEAHQAKLQGFIDMVNNS